MKLIGRNRKPKKKLLVKLTRDELNEINAGQRRLDEAAAQTRMIAYGQRFAWYKVLKKYKITAEYDFDHVTGSIYERVKDG